MTCREFADFLAQYLDDDLPAEQRTVFQEHLAECPDCVAYLDSYAATIELGHDAFNVPLDETMPEELVRAILDASQPTK